MRKKLLYGGLIALIASTVSCSKSDGPSVEPPTEVTGEYAMIYSTDAGSFLLGFNTLTEGTISPLGKGVDISSIFTWQENIIQKGKYFYHLQPESGKFGKYKFEDGKLTTEAEIPVTVFPSPYLAWHIWIDDSQVMFGPRSSNLYAIVNVNTMTLVKSGEFDTNGIPADHDRQIYSVIPRGNQLLIGYGLYNKKAEVSYDSSYMAVMDYPSLTNLRVTSKDGRSAPIGALRNGYFSQLTDNGNTYILTHPIALGANKPAMPTGFFRVKAGSDEIDPEYFFNTTALTGDKQLGVCDLGGGKAVLISAHDTDNNVKEWDDWWYAAMWEYLVIDVNTQEIVRKLDFPSLMNSRSAIVQDGRAYIAVNDPSADAVYIWEYDPNTDQLRKGLKVEGADSDTPTIFKLD